MNTKETLRRRKDIPDEHVEELVARAAQLQEESQTPKDTVSATDIEAVATELNIESQYVEAAIEEWRRGETSKPREEARTRVKQRGKAIIKGLLIFAGVTVVGGSLLGWALWNTFGSTVFFAIAGGIAAVIAGIIWLLS